MVGRANQPSQNIYGSSYALPYGVSTPQPLLLGPFVGGLNTASDPAAVADVEVVTSDNFELDTDGSLVSRPPIVETTNYSASWTKRIVMIGRATLAGVNYVIGSNSDGTYAFDGTTWTLIKAGLESRVALQYRDALYVVPVPGCAVAGGYWQSGAWTADASMPQGEAAVFHKTRMWVCAGKGATSNTSRLSFTNVVTSNTLSWDAVNNIFDINPGDGQNLVDIVINNDNLMLFKESSTYVLAYDIRPTDAILRNINPNIGATTRRCVVSYESSIFVYCKGLVYEIVNYDFQRINFRVPFTYDSTTPGTRAEEVFLSLVGDRLVVRYYNGIYVFNLKARTWCTWSSSDQDLHNFGPLVAMPSTPVQSVNIKYYGGSAILATEKVFYIPDGFDNTTVEHSTTGGNVTITSTMRTKTFQFDDAMHFKRMMWWGADCITSNAITGIVNPVTNSYQVTWASLAGVTWGSLNAATSTWDQPGVATTLAQTTVTLGNIAVKRLFAKFLKSLRFRQVYFIVQLTGDGSTVTGPARLFTLTAIVGTKQTVGKQVS